MFRKILIDKCQHEFEKNKAAELRRDERLKEINTEQDPVSLFFFFFADKLFNCIEKFMMIILGHDLHELIVDSKAKRILIVFLHFIFYIK